MPCVYVLSSSDNPDHIRYVGVTKYDNADRRINAHMYRTKTGSNLPVHCWIRKHIDLGHRIEHAVVVILSDWSAALEQEQAMIKKYRSLGYDLVNVTDGGEGTVGHVQSDSTRKKRSDSLKGRQISDETKVKISKANIGRRRTEEAKQKMRSAKLGKSLSRTHRQRIGESLMGRPVSEDTRKKISDAQKGKVLAESHLQNVREGQRRRRSREQEEKSKKATNE